MRKKNIDPDMPIGKLTRIEDFLPPPEDLIMPQNTVKVTITLSGATVESFKKFAEKHHTKYQKVIRKLLDEYASKYLA